MKWPGIGPALVLKQLSLGLIGDLKKKDSTVQHYSTVTAAARFLKS